MVMVFAGVVIVSMIVLCFVLSGESIIAGSIFEKKTPVRKK